MKKLIMIVTLSIALLISGANESFASSPTYKVKKGDSLYKISLAHNTTVAKLKSMNNLKSNLIHPNQKLKVTVGSKAKTKPKKKAKPKVKPKVQVMAKTKTPSRSTSSKVKKEFMATATAYTANCNGCSGITKTGINLKKNAKLKVIAVDPKVIPLGSKVHVEGYGYAVAGDIGGAIKGNKIDVFIPTKKAAFKWGRKRVKVKVLQ